MSFCCSLLHTPMEVILYLSEEYPSSFCLLYCWRNIETIDSWYCAWLQVGPENLTSGLHVSCRKALALSHPPSLIVVIMMDLESPTKHIFRCVWEGPPERFHWGENTHPKFSDTLTCIEENKQRPSIHLSASKGWSHHGQLPPYPVTKAFPVVTSCAPKTWAKIKPSLFSCSFLETCHHDHHEIS